jgi:ribosomal protein S18 acetylase RimI-like enzyme
MGDAGDDLSVRQLSEDDWDRLPELLESAHGFDPPFSLMEEPSSTRAARKCIEFLHSGGEGELIETACKLATEAGDQHALLGAVIVTKAERNRFFWDAGRRSRQTSAAGQSGEGPWIPHLTWALVRAWEQRRGIGTKLLNVAVEALRRSGQDLLASSFLLGNSSAMSWHWRNGFELVDSTNVGRLAALDDFEG